MINYIIYHLIDYYNTIYVLTLFTLKLLSEIGVTKNKKAHAGYGVHIGSTSI